MENGSECDAALEVGGYQNETDKTQFSLSV